MFWGGAPNRAIEDAKALFLAVTAHFPNGVLSEPEYVIL